MRFTEACAVFSSQPTASLRDLGLSEIRTSQLDELVSRLLPTLGPEEPPAVPSTWRTSHVSAHSFFHNKHGEAAQVTELNGRSGNLFVSSHFSETHFCFSAGFSHRRVGVFGSPILHRQHHSPLKDVCSELQFLPSENLTLTQLKLLICIVGARTFLSFSASLSSSMGPESRF